MNLEGSYSLSAVNSVKRARKEGSNWARLAQTENKDTTVTSLEHESGWYGGSQNSEAGIIKATRTFPEDRASL